MKAHRDKLPQRVIKLATDMFAGTTGFSGPELYDLFADYTDRLGSYPWAGGAPSRRQIFQTGLTALTVDEQWHVLLTTCRRDEWGKHGSPSAENKETLRSLLVAGTSPGAPAAGARLADLVDWGGVQRSWQATLDKVGTDPDGAITAARTTLESICKHICDERNVPYDDAWDLPHLYKVTARGLDIAPDHQTEQIIKQILGGVASVVDGLAAMRNRLSDAHGKGKRAARPAPRHAKLAVNAAFAVAGFLIDTHVEKRAVS